MSAQNWIIVAALGDGRRIIRGTSLGGVLDAASSFTVHIGMCDRVERILDITNNAGWIVEAGDCTITRNDIVVVVRRNPVGAGPHELAPYLTDLTAVTFGYTLVVH